MNPAAEERKRETQRAIKEVGLSRAHVARIAHVDASTVFSWIRRPNDEAGRAPTKASVLRLARGLREYSERVARVAERLERVIRHQQEE